MAADPENTLIMTLSSGGDVVINLRPDLAPQHVDQIVGAALDALLQRRDDGIDELLLQPVLLIELLALLARRLFLQLVEVFVGHGPRLCL